MKNKDLKSIKVLPKDHEKFSIMCVKQDMNQDEMFHELLLAYKTLENQE